MVNYKKLGQITSGALRTGRELVWYKFVSYFEKYVMWIKYHDGGEVVNKWCPLTDMT